jgi:hypothetical protein
VILKQALNPEQKVLIIYDTHAGFVQKPAIFKEYQSIILNNISHRIPVFDCNGVKITGTECFWIPFQKNTSQDEIRRLQCELVPLQISAIEASAELGYEIPRKIKDVEVKKMAEENITRTQAIIKKLGFDPRDESWIESEMAITNRERNWYRFERENDAIFNNSWDGIVSTFNKQYGDNISLNEAQILSKKRNRYILGAYMLRMSGNANKREWAKSAKEFEIRHRDIEKRMNDWSQKHINNFPTVKTKKPIGFFFGPYYNQCIERAPRYFSDVNCNMIKEGTTLRVISFDPVSRCIRLDFPLVVREDIKGKDGNNTPWIKNEPDYEFFVKPDEIEECLEIVSGDDLWLET